MQVKKTQLNDELFSGNGVDDENAPALVQLKANRLRTILCQDLLSDFLSVILGAVARRGRVFFIVS